MGLPTSCGSGGDDRRAPAPEGQCVGAERSDVPPHHPQVVPVSVETNESNVPLQVAEGSLLQVIRECVAERPCTREDWLSTSPDLIYVIGINGG